MRNDYEIIYIKEVITINKNNKLMSRRRGAIDSETYEEFY